MKAAKIQGSKISRFINNAISKAQKTKIKGGENDFLITEDCVDM